ncbi:accessory gene regulator ArgB-like protein [Cohnella faecalis]|uniref:accessory gene regulator ArgB-like protein n=1 Tax=Cohnella faecalis TaxID=2315694 RepID=UPI001313DEA7|nr:accessory gene regulator B family protein [Cohnella faecalis]
MIHKLSYGIANYIKKSEPEATASVAVMQYSLYIILHSLFTAAIIFIIGAATGRFFETFIGLAFFVVLRLIAGGYHLHSSTLCTILSIALINAAPFVSMPDRWIPVVTIVCAIFVLIYAPRNFKGYARIPERYYPYMKIVAFAVVCSNLFWHSATIGFVSVLHTAMLVPQQKGGENE